MSQVLILDTCHAGGLNQFLSGLYDARMSTLAKSVGLHLYASAASTEQALDGEFGQNSPFTQSILESLGHEAKDDDGDNFIGIIELGRYTKQMLKKHLDILFGKEYPQNPKFMHFGRDLRVYRVAQ